MIVEDEVDIRALLEAAISREHFQVTAVSDGIEALMAVLKGVTQQYSYAVVVLDCAMPFADGFSIARAIRCLETNHVIPQRTKIGLYTGYPELLKPSTLLEESLKESDIDGFVPKPDHEELLKMITRLAGEEIQTNAH